MHDLSLIHILSDFRTVQGVLLDGEQSETGRVLELAPEVFQKILEHAGITVYFQKGVPVFPGFYIKVFDLLRILFLLLRQI